MNNTIIELVNNDRLLICCNEIPQPYARAISPFDSVDEVRDKKLFPFKLANSVDMVILHKEKGYNLHFPKGFSFDGASIPRWIWTIAGSNADPAFLIPAMVHDLICNKHELINHDRALSSLIFKELLLACHVKPWRANLMYIAVDNYQKVLVKWGNK